MSMSNFHLITIVAMCSAILPVSHAAAGSMSFLRGAEVSEDVPQLAELVLPDVQRLFGDSHPLGGETRVAHFEELLRPTFRSLPLSDARNLAPVGARYALHRLFVQRHGWFVRGLEPHGDGWNTSSPVDVIEGRVPDEVWTLFDARFRARGLSLHEVSLFAVVLESLAHAEAAERLSSASQAQGLTTEGELSRSQAETLIDVYMASHILGEDLSALSTAEAQQRRDNISDIYPGWPQAQAFARGIEAEVVGDRASLVMTDVGAIVEEIGDRYGRWQNHECRDLKAELLALADEGTGRVPLSRFYSSALHGGKWQFTESSSYLRQLGALDESDPSDPRVIVSNYINSPTNCVASSSYYSVCCLDECEDLFGHLEKQLAAPDATPAEIAALVAALPSGTVQANRTLPASLRQHLEDIATTHGGRVPLHGRLFAQWMHHAYPNECTFPHVAGTTSPLRTEDFQRETGVTTSATMDEMTQYIESAPRRRAKVQEGRDCAPWHDEEELFVPRPLEVSREEKAATAPVWIFTRSVMLLLAAGSVLVTLARTVGSAASAGVGAPGAKFDV